ASRLLEIAAEPGGNIGSYRDAANAPHGIEAKRHVVISGELNELFPAFEALSGHAAEVSSRVFDRDDFRVIRHCCQGFDRYVCDRPRRYVVDDDWKRRCVCNGGEMGS